MTPQILLRPISDVAADALADGRVPTDVRVADDYALDRPASGRVLEKAGVALTGEQDDEHDGVPMRVRRWELALQ
jgi:hypothetical protein